MIPHQSDDHQSGTDKLGYGGGRCSAQHTHSHFDHEKKIQNNVGHTCGNEEIERTAGIAGSPKYRRANIVQEGSGDTQKIYLDIGFGISHDLVRGTHGPQCRRGSDYSQNGHGRAAGQRQGDGAVDSLAYLIIPLGAVVLGDDHRDAGGDANKKVNEQVDQRAGGTTHSGQCFLAHEPANNYGIGGIIQLLEKCTQKDGKEKEQELLPDNSFRDAICPCGR